MHINKTINSSIKNSEKNTLNKGKSQNSKLKYFSRSHSLKINSNNNLEIKRFPFKNPLGNFIGGFVEKLAYGENRFYDCFPKSWLSDDSMDQEGQLYSNSLEANLTKWVQGLSAFISLGATLIQFFCKFKIKIIKFIQRKFIKSKLKKLRVMFESGNGTRAIRLMSKKYGWNKGNQIKDNIKTAANLAKDKAKKVRKIIKENIADPIFNKWFLPVKNKVLKLVKRIKDFFSSDFIKKIQNCVNNLSVLKGKFDKIFNGLKKKFDYLNFSITLGPVFSVVFASDFLVALVCEYQDLLEGITLISKGAQKKDKNDRNYHLGKGIGVLFRTFATAPTVFEKINHIKRFKRLYFS